VPTQDAAKAVSFVLMFLVLVEQSRKHCLPQGAWAEYFEQVLSLFGVQSELLKRRG
jgi:hypothetical protein